LLGRTDPAGLSRHGLARAASLAQHLRRLPISALLSSPLRRAIETATTIAQQLAFPIQIAQALNEVDYGRWTGRSFAELASDPAWLSFNLVRSGAQIPGGENIEEVERRIVAQLQKWTDDYPAKFIIALTHAEIVRIAVLQSLGLSSNCYGQIEISPCSVTVLRWEAGWRQIICLNESGELNCLTNR
jgi:broad specificity phosphatase PhoE